MFPKQKFLVVSFAALLATNASVYAAEGVNLVGKILGAPTVTLTEDGKGSIQVFIEVKNLGATALTNATIRLKPFLVSEKTVTTWPERGGRVLSWKEVPVTLPAGGRTTVIYQSGLPKVTKGAYGISVIVNSNGKIAETSLADNATDLVSLGEFETTTSAVPSATQVAAGAPAPTFDLITDTGDSMEISGGYIHHPLRTYAVGPSRSAPQYNGTFFGAGMTGNNSNKLFGRLMLINKATKKVYTALYDNQGYQGPQNPEKNWYLVSWHDVEQIASGDFRQHDLYSESTLFDGMPPGDYKYLILINSRDLVDETDVHNNLSVYDVKINAATATVPTSDTQAQKIPELWIVGSPNGRNEEAHFSLSTDYSRLNLTSVRASADSPWFNLLGTSGGSQINLGDEFSSQSLGAVGGAIEGGTQQGRLVYTGGSLVGGEIHGTTEAVRGEIPVTYFARRGRGTPQLEFSAESVDVEEFYSDMLTRTETVTITNPGDAELQWKSIGLPVWVRAEPVQGTIAAGGSATITLTFDPHYVNRGEPAETKLRLLTNISSGGEGLRDLPISMTVSREE